MADSPILPGRLGAPNMSLLTDPRADPRMIAAMAPLGIAELPPPSPVDGASSIEALHEYINVSEQGFDMLGGMLIGDVAPVTGVTSSVEVIRGVDGNDVTLFIHRPSSSTGPVPGVVHIHGAVWCCSMRRASATHVGATNWRARRG